MANPTASVISSLAPEALAGPAASQPVSASSYGRPEDIGVAAVIVPPFEFGNVKRQIFGADVVERADNAALQERPETVNRLSVNVAAHVFAGAVVDDLVRVFVQVQIAPVFVGSQKIDLGGDRFTDERAEVFACRVSQDAGDHVALAFHGADHWDFVGRATALLPLISVPVLVLAPDIGLIDLDDAHQLAELGIGQPSANTMRYLQRGLVRPEPHDPLDLKAGNAFLAGHHEIDDFEPLAQSDLGILEDGLHQDREAVSAALPAVWALPVKRAGRQGVDALRAAARAMHAVGPAPRGQV